MINFLNIPGLDDIKQKLNQSITSKTLPSTILLTGLEGGGAFPLAVSIAKALICENSTEKGSCESCISCTQFNNQNYPDLHFAYPIERKGKETSSADFMSEFFAQLDTRPYLTNQSWRNALNVGNKQLLIPAKDADNIIHNLSLTTFSKQPRVFIIWQPELLNNTASNRLLKSLEEPGENTYFVLVSHHPEKVLNTIMSRCVRYTIPPNKALEIEHYLTNTGFSADSISKALLYAEGSIGYALDQLDEEDVTNEYYNQLIAWFRTLYSGNLNELVNWTENSSRMYREQLKQFLLYASHLLQQGSGISIGSHSGPVFSHNTFSIERFAPFIRVHKMNEILHAIERAYKDIERNGNPKIILLDLSLTLTKYIGKA